MKEHSPNVTEDTSLNPGITDKQCYNVMDVLFDELIEQHPDGLNRSVEFLFWIVRYDNTWLRVFLNSISDRELELKDGLKNRPFIWDIGKYLRVTDKRLAMATARFLSKCCGNYGVFVIREYLEHHRVEHENLIRRITNIYNAQ